ncbi:MAG: FAD-dependent oxidoreductase [Alphaproteobacteria bacterium]|nr:FAD-dependent oxidoreductase [Alphaproteobacteria bacterium]
MTTDPACPSLGLGFSFPDLYARGGLARLDAAFLARLDTADPGLHARLLAARAAPEALAPLAESSLILEIAPHLDDFIGALFGIAEQVRALAKAHRAEAPLAEAKRNLVQRRALKQIDASAAAALDGVGLAAALKEASGFASPTSPAEELRLAEQALDWAADEAAHGAALEAFLRYAAWATQTVAGRARHPDSLLFRAPRKLDPLRLVHTEPAEILPGVTAHALPEARLRRREGFALTDPGMALPAAIDQMHYCIWCHTQGKDSCSRGFADKKAGGFRKSPLGVTLAGCPLDEKISEMHAAKCAGHMLGALAIICIDNPMLAATGHRICNDCMKACIYQKQDPVDIPQAETRILKDVLALPWGFEIYGLLTRWNPLDLRRPLPKPPSGYKVLVVGLGPAGFTLAHHLINEGHAVVAIDGLKIEPLDPALSGRDANGNAVPFRPVRDIESLREPLQSRAMAGFGGVAEYGITVRWDKNFLKLVRLLLERREAFTMLGGVRFGGQITAEGAFAAGFDHIALCLGAGKPTVVAMKNGLAPGVRQASDFLMALQLTGAARADSIANLELRLPVVVIGGGLTAIDTATECLAYYPVQVERFLARFEMLAAERGEAAIRAGWGPAEAEIAEEFLAHARAIRAERMAAAHEGRPARLRELLQGWGGATIAYRRRLIDAPSYTLNHEEVEKALEEGVRFAELLNPVAVELDAHGRAAGLRVAVQVADAAGKASATGAEHVLPARAILVAAGTQPNTVLAREDAAHFGLDGKYFRALDEAGNAVQPERVAKPQETRVLTAIEPDGRAISYFGDLHPSFAGNVVKAMASAKRGYPVIGRMLVRRAPTPVAPEALAAAMHRDLSARVHAVQRLAPGIVEVVVEAPAAARAFRPGQFFRLQNFEALAPGGADGARLAMEGLAMTGAWVDQKRGLVAVIALEMGGSSDLCAHLRPGEPVVLMGPTGTATEIAAGETVLLVGGGLGNAVLFSIGAAFRAAGSRVLYFAGYRRMRDRYHVARIEAAADQVVWACDEAPGFAPSPSRPQDASFAGNMLAALLAYAEGRIGAGGIPLGAVDRVVCIGSDGLMGAVAKARHTILAPHLKPDHIAIGSINSPMQCMMKEVCAQCLQVHRDPATGAESVVFSCFNQDQPLDLVDFANLHDRLSQNATQEKLTAHWIDRALRSLALRGAAE